MCQWPLPGGCVFSGLMNRHSTTGSSEPRGPAGGIDGGRRRCRSRAPRGGGLAAFNAREKRRATAWGDEHPPSSLLAGAAPTWEREFEDGCHCREPETLSSLAGGTLPPGAGGGQGGGPRAAASALRGWQSRRRASQLLFMQNFPGPGSPPPPPLPPPVCSTCFCCWFPGMQLYCSCSGGLCSVSQCGFQISVLQQKPSQEFSGSCTNSGTGSIWQERT